YFSDVITKRYDDQGTSVQCNREMLSKQKIQEKLPVFVNAYRLHTDIDIVKCAKKRDRKINITQREQVFYCQKPELMGLSDIFINCGEVMVIGCSYNLSKQFKKTIGKYMLDKFRV
ncbi:1987_t:CDS:2, partial [Racocetra fulgida]